jgi:hypothetical protein
VLWPLSCKCECKNVLGYHVWSDYEIWRDGDGDILLCPSSQCAGSLFKIWVDGVVLAQIPAISKIRLIRISLSDHGFWNRSTVSSALLLTVTVHERCLCGYVKENQFSVLSIHSSEWNKSTEIHSVFATPNQKIQVMRSDPFRISGKISNFETKYTFCPSAKSGLTQFTAASPLTNEYENYTPALCGILLRCAVGGLHFDIWIRNDITDAAFRAASLYDLKYYDKLSLVASLQLCLWGLRGDPDDQTFSDGKQRSAPSRLRVVLSSDSNPVYGFCLPVAALFWKRILGFNVTVFLVGRQWDRSLECVRGDCRWMRIVRAALDELGVETEVLGEGRHPPGLVAQVARLYAAVRRRPESAETESKRRGAGRRCEEGEWGSSEEYVCPMAAARPSEEYVVVSDADVLPLSREAYMRRDWRRAMHLFNAFEPGLFRPCLPAGRREARRILLEPGGPAERGAAWGVAGDAVGMFAMSHVGAGDGVWRSVMGVPRRRLLEALWRQHATAQPGHARKDGGTERQADGETADGETAGGQADGARTGDVDEALTWWIGRRLDADLGPDGPGGGQEWHPGDVRTGPGQTGRQAGGGRCGGWWYDQRLLSGRLHAWARFPGLAELIPRDTARDRIDRARWAYRVTRGRAYSTALDTVDSTAGRGPAGWAVLDAVWGRPGAVDAHVPLPLHGGAAWGAVQGLVRAMMAQGDVLWLDAYRARFRLEAPA